jgi:hypothetical protein
VRDEEACMLDVMWDDGGAIGFAHEDDLRKVGA